MSRLKIIHYCPRMQLALGGVVRAVLDWCSVLAARGNEVILATYDSPDAPADWDGSPGKPKVVWLPGAAGNKPVPAEAVRIWEKLLTPPAAAHLHTPWMASNMQMARACRRAGVPYIVSIHGMLDDWSMAQRTLKKRLFLTLGGRRFLRAADRIHYTAAAERDQAQKWAPGSRAAVLPYLVDLSQFQTLPGREMAAAKFDLDSRTPVVLFLSRLHEKKGVEILIDAADCLRREGRKFKMLIAGSAAATEKGYEQRLGDLVQRLGLGEVVFFVGLVTGAEKISLYQAADLFVLPTHQENFGLVLIEAMAAGTPVLTTRGTDIWREITEAGATISEIAAAPLSEAMGKLLGDRAALAESGRRAREWVMKRFAVDALAGEYERLYAQIIAEHRS
jgi:glycosyltransferase involved in cell wall biosynthesis